MLQNLLAAYSGSSNGSSSGSDVGSTVSGILASYGVLILIILAFLSVRWIVQFLIPFYIRSIKNSQIDIADLLEEQVHASANQYKLEKKRLKIEKQRLAIEKEKLALLRAHFSLTQEVPEVPDDEQEESQL